MDKSLANTVTVVASAFTFIFLVVVSSHLLSEDWVHGKSSPYLGLVVVLFCVQVSMLIGLGISIFLKRWIKYDDTKENSDYWG